jgi:hypothetical protein
LAIVFGYQITINSLYGYWEILHQVWVNSVSKWSVFRCQYVDLGWWVSIVTVVASYRFLVMMKVMGKSSHFMQDFSVYLVLRNQQHWLFFLTTVKFMLFAYCSFCQIKLYECSILSLNTVSTMPLDLAKMLNISNWGSAVLWYVSRKIILWCDAWKVK